MARILTEPRPIVGNCLDGGRPEKPMTLGAEPVMNLLAATDTTLRLTEAAIHNWEQELRVFASLRRRLEAARNELVASSKERQHA